ncbi:MAG: hypothetical protein QXK37_06595 [Candidatus Woesearchaeota archaeon]
MKTKAERLLRILARNYLDQENKTEIYLNKIDCRKDELQCIAEEISEIQQRCLSLTDCVNPTELARLKRALSRIKANLNSIKPT